MKGWKFEKMMLAQKAQLLFEIVWGNLQASVYNDEFAKSTRKNAMRPFLRVR